MTNDPVQEALDNAGVEPSPAFEAGLEQTLSRALDGETIPPSVGTRSTGQRRRAVLIGAAAAVVVAAAVVGVVALTGESGTKSIVGSTTPDTFTNPEPTVEPAATVAPSTTVEPSTSIEPAPPATVAPTPAATTIDLTVAVSELTPNLLVSYPSAPAGDLFPTALATVSGDRLVVFDASSGQLRFVDAESGVELANYDSTIPRIGDQTFIAGNLMVGPDEVIYVNEGSADPLPSIVAYALSDGSYVEVARATHGVGDGTVMLGREGITVDSVVGPLLLSYVSGDGQPSGATLQLDDLNPQCSSSPDTFSYERAGNRWAVTYLFPSEPGLPAEEPCARRPAWYLGPSNSVVLTIVTHTPDGDLERKLTLLSDDITTYDTDWDYIGAIDEKMVFSRLDQDSIDIGTVEI